MKVRLGENLLRDLQKASGKYNYSYSEIARKAIRKARRLQPDLAHIEVDSTYRGEAIRLDLKEENPATAEELRRVLVWYLNQYNLNTPVEPGFVTNLKAGADYFLLS